MNAYLSKSAFDSYYVLSHFQGKDEGRDDAGTPAPSKGDKKLTNQFNFSERASQTYNNPYRVSGSTDLQLSHDVTSGIDITSWNKVDKPLVLYRFGNVT